MRKLITFTIILISTLSLFRFYTRFKVYAAPIPPGVYLAGLDLSTLKDTAEIRQHLEHIYSEPIAVYFADKRLWLHPDEVDFRLDIDQMIFEASRYLEGPDFIDIAMREAIGAPQRRRDVKARYTMDSAKLSAWLHRVAVEHNQDPQPARATIPVARWNDGTLPSGLPSGYVGAFSRNWAWSDGAPGYELKMEESVLGLIAGLVSLEERTAHLVLSETPPPSPSMQDLADTLDNYLSNFPGFAAVYVQDLTTGEEARVDDEVSFSGMSTLKIGIVAALMQQMDGFKADDRVSIEVGQWMDFALGESNNYAANLLVQQLGGGDIGTGARIFTDFMRKLGFVNTYMQSGYDAKSQLAQIPTPGNQRTDWNTNPDSNLQSTPLDMGRLLAAIYQCTQDTGLLIKIFPQDFTPEECEHILFYLSHDEFQELLWAGLPRPNDTWFMHKHGFAFESHSDVALVWGPTGPYVISVFLYRAGWMDWGTSNTAMKDVSRITWDFFAYQAQFHDIEPSKAPELTTPPGYVPVGNYVPAS